MHSADAMARQRAVAATIASICLAGLAACSTLPPGADYPKSTSVALTASDDSRLGRQFAIASRQHSGDSGFRIISIGVDGFLTRVQMIDAAEKTLDLQYYIFRGDETGSLICGALLRAADRGVRVRVLVDDGDTVAGDERIAALDTHPAIEVRIFNPFAYRGHNRFRRVLEFVLHAGRLDYRMHNKLIVADNAVALIGGRNIGNQYFQMDPESQFADDDVFVAGPVTAQLSSGFDEYWNSGLAIPSAALHRARPANSTRAQPRASRRRQLQPLQAPGIDYPARIATGEPYAGLVSGRLPVSWAAARVICDSPDKKRVVSGARPGQLMSRAVSDATAAVQSEILLVTPYFIPGPEELRALRDLRLRNARVRILTNSLESAASVAAHSGYMRYRTPLLEQGAEIDEVRSQPGSARGSGQTAAMSRYGTYSLHAKLFVFDRRRVFIGSMNFDQRSRHLNTEVGMIIDAPDLAQQTATRFEAMTQPQNSYAVTLLPGRAGHARRLVWRSAENGAPVEYSKEPARSNWQRIKVHLLALVPMSGEL